MSLVNDALERDASLETILALMQRRDFNIDFQEPGSLETLLLFAIRKEREDVVLELILRGANVELSDRHGITPLLAACSRNLVSVAHALFQAGGDINRACPWTWTPLALAAYNGHLSMVRKMLSWGADPNGVGTHLLTARRIAEWGSNGIAVKCLDTCGSLLVVRAAEEVRRVAARSALKFLPKDMGRLVGEMLV
jgi:ankyrin repeat protein